MPDPNLLQDIATWLEKPYESPDYNPRCPCQECRVRIDLLQRVRNALKETQ